AQAREESSAQRRAKKQVSKGSPGFSALIMRPFRYFYGELIEPVIELYRHRHGDPSALTIELLGEGVGTPGAVELLVGRFELLIRLAQRIIGLRLVLFLSVIDGLLDLLLSYLRSATEFISSLKSAARQFQRQRHGRVVKESYRDIVQLQLGVARLLQRADYRWEEVEASTLTPSEGASPLFQAGTPPLSQALRLRRLTDAARRDLRWSHLREIQSGATQQLTGSLLSLVPNPFSLFAPLKDGLLLFFFRPSRRHLHETVRALGQAYRPYLQALESASGEVIQDDDWRTLFLGTQEQDTPLSPALARELFATAERLTVEKPNEEALFLAPKVDLSPCRAQLRALLIALIRVDRCARPRHWRPEEWLLEGAGESPAVTLARESWLASALAQAEHHRGQSPSREERRLREQEAHAHLLRARLEHHLWLKGWL
ncbi:MAG: hypothetical protein VYD19_05295, partial [Myxococcota bacterium]|nr:hypothetical protein [Myxococcota bacterium]